jgi:hypothetical protein
VVFAVTRSRQSKDAQSDGRFAPILLGEDTKKPAEITHYSQFTVDSFFCYLYYPTQTTRFSQEEVTAQVSQLPGFM